MYTDFISVHTTYQFLKISMSNMNDVCRFSRDHVVECSERTALTCLESVYVRLSISENQNEQLQRELKNTPEL